ncbi:MAG: hypothetical protein WCD35_04955 [Mycobacteriales bacterium]
MITITRSGDAYRATDGATTFQAVTMAELVRLLSEAGCHSTDISDAVDAAGLTWPGEDE